MMSLFNETGFTPSTLILVGFPGLERYHSLLAIPLCAIYIATVLGNSLIMLTVKAVPSLHRPMFLFMSQLAFFDVAFSSCIIPKMLDIFWFNGGEIGFSACLAQMSLSLCCVAMETAILSTMAFDRYVAVCHPLRYSSILTHSLMTKTTAASLVRAIVAISPVPFITMRLPFCSRYVAFSYCESMAVAKLSCVDTTLNNVYMLTISLSIGGMDLLCIASSYILILREILNLPQKDRFKAISTCGSHACVISALYIPVCFTLALHRLHHSLPLYVHVTVGNTCFLFPPLINPIIYGVTMKEMRKGVQQMFQKTRDKLKTFEGPVLKGGQPTC